MPRRRYVGYTLNAVRTRRQQQEEANWQPIDKVDYVYDYIRASFDNFVTSRITHRVNDNLRSDPTFFIPLDWNARHSVLREAILNSYDIDEEEYENFGLWDMDDNRELFRRLQIYFNSLFDATHFNSNLKGIFDTPSFVYNVEHRTFRTSVNNIDALQRAEWVPYDEFERPIDNFLGGGSDQDSNLPASDRMVNAWQLATEVGIMLPFRTIQSRRNREPELPKLKNINALRSMVYRTRRSGAFYPFLLSEDYIFFYDIFKLAQISHDANDSIYKDHCLIYAIKQLDIIQEDKDRLINAMLEYTIEFKDNVKKKAKVNITTLRDIFVKLQLPYNLYLKTSVTGGGFEYDQRFATPKKNNPHYQNINLLFDNEHYMIDFELPFTRCFASKFEQIFRYHVKYSKENPNDDRDLSYYFNVTAVNGETPIFRRNATPNHIWFHDLLFLAKQQNWFKPMSEYMYTALMTLPTINEEEKQLPNACNYMNDPLRLSNPAYNKRYDKIMYFDFESLPNTKRHIPFMVVLMEADYSGDNFPIINYNGMLCGSSEESHVNFDDSNYRVFIGWDCVDDMFTYLSSLKPDNWESTLSAEDKEKNPTFNILCYAHNLMYDGRFLRGHHLISFIEKGNRCYQQTHLLPNNTMIVFKDFLALTNTALKKLPNWYPKYFDHLRLHKEIYFYDSMHLFVNPEPTNEDDFFLRTSMPMTEFCSVLFDLGHNENEISDFLEVYQELSGENGFPETYDFIRYTLFYCCQDVKVLKVCHQIFRHEVKHSILDMNIDYFLTSPSLSKHWFEREIFKPIEFVYKVNSTLQEFLLKACHGGRCMTARNRKYHVQNNILNIDAVSLYPSAMSMMYVPRGKPSVIPQEHLFSDLIWTKTHKHPIWTCLFYPNQKIANNYRYCSHFVVEIEIVEVGKNRDFPSIVRHEKDGKHNTNTIGNVYCDNIMLEDLIEFHEIKYRIIRGVWWVNFEIVDRKGQIIPIKASRNYDIQDKIRELFNLRKMMKAIKNPQERIVKLLLNSGFGSMMQRPIKTDIKVMNIEGMEDILVYNSCYLKEYERVLNEHFVESDIYIVKMLADTSHHYNLAFLASLVLSYSKRIMNILMYSLEDMNVPIYYTDTDSIHVHKEKFLEAIPTIEQRLQKQLIGNDLCQFHNDYDGGELGIYDSNHPDPGNSLDLYAVEGYYLSKKIYAERVKSVTYPDREGIFYRLKGVPENCIRDAANDLFDGDIMRLYKALYDNYGIVFDIAKSKTVFRFNTDYIYNLNDFSRTIKCCYSKLDPDVLTIHNETPEESEFCIIKKNSIDQIIANSLQPIGIYGANIDFEPEEEQFQFSDIEYEMYRSVHCTNTLLSETGNVYQTQNEEFQRLDDSLSLVEERHEEDEDEQLKNYRDDYYSFFD